MVSNSKTRYNSGIVVASVIVVMAAASAALFIQSLLVRWGFDRLWSSGLVILFAAILFLILGPWYLLSAIASGLCETSPGSMMLRHSVIFAPLLTLYPFTFLPDYNRQNVVLHYLILAMSSMLLMGIGMVLKDWRERTRTGPRQSTGGKTFIMILGSLVLSVVFVKVHDLQLQRSGLSQLGYASCDGVLFPIAPVKMPGKFSAELYVPEGGALRIAAFRNDHWKEEISAPPLHYEVRVTARDSEAIVAAGGRLDFGDVSYVTPDVSIFENKTITIDYVIGEPISPGALAGRLHALFRTIPWNSKTRGRALEAMAPAYWADTVVYVPRRADEKNVLLVIVDTLRVDHVSSYGYRLKTTPNIDRLAEDGIVFTQAISQSPWTIPSIASILTGRLPTSHRGGMKLGTLDVTMLSWQPSLVDSLRKSGYYSAGFVNNPFLIPDYGMHQFYDEYHQYGPDAEVGSDKVCAWLERNLDKKFFCLLHYMDPHRPRKVRDEFRPRPVGSLETTATTGTSSKSPGSLADDRSENSKYDSEIFYTDAQFGRVVEKLHALGLTEHTLIVVLSDHGEEFWDHKGYEHGHSLYDELLRVPLVMSFPTGPFEGRRINTQVRLVDVMPTVLDYLGMEYEAENVAGRSLLPLIRGETSTSENAVSEYLLYGSELKSIRTGRYKLIYRPTTGRVELYDVSVDPGEKVDISSREPELRTFLLSELERVLRESDAGDTAKIESPDLDKDTIESLRSLGYLD